MPTAEKRRLREPMPRSVELQLCTLIDEPFDDPEWIFEPKLDGLRVLVRFDGGHVRLISRNDKEQGVAFPEIVAGLERCVRGPVILDGEVVCLDENGLSSFPRIQQRFHVADRAEVQRRMGQYPAHIYLFDAMYASGRNLTRLPLLKRKEALHAAVRWRDPVREIEFIAGRGTALYHEMCDRRGEGIIGKRADRPYRGGRGGDWVKIKCGLRQEFVIGGFTEPQRTRVGLGALLVGYYDDDGQTLRYAGKVGTGYDNRTLADLRKRLENIELDRSPFPPGEGPTRGRWGGANGAVHWVKPALVAEVAFSEWTPDGSLRHPRFEGLRMDKKPKQVRRERPRATSRAVKRGAPGRSATAQRGSSPQAEKPGRSNTGERPLERYNQKRNFSRTPEPSGKKGRKESKSKGPTFVIQKHDASRLHYDLRLEAEGVLKSWAVPKVPTADPNVKRLAVEVEDHPLDYGGFEGVIPEGNYGAGTVEIWDRGTYVRLQHHEPVEGDIAEDHRRGKIEVEFHGKRLKGGYAIVRTGGRDGKPSWLLIKLRDEHATPGTAEDDEAREAARRPNQASGRVWQSSRPAPGGRGRTLKTESVEVPETPEPPDEIPFTNTSKVMFPKAPYTKGDLLDYYRKIAPHLVPHIKDRPASLERMPDGISGVRFWQKNTPPSYPAWIPRVELATEAGKPVKYVLINSEQALLYLVNQGTITIHTGFSRVQSLTTPDFVLFDLDLGEAEFGAVVKIARSLRPLIAKRSADPAVKTSGKSGLHVTVPWTGGGGFEAARTWAREIAEQLVDQVPDIATLERSKSGRHGKVYIDIEQNALGKHAVPPYVVRAVSEATVSTPLEWDEITPRLDPRQFTIETVFKRLEKRSARKSGSTTPGRGAAARGGRSRAGTRRRAVSRR